LGVIAALVTGGLTLVIAQQQYDGGALSFGRLGEELEPDQPGSDAREPLRAAEPG
jgi:hypothetical protein